MNWALGSKASFLNPSNLRIFHEEVLHKITKMIDEKAVHTRIFNPFRHDYSTYKMHYQTLGGGNTEFQLSVSRRKNHIIAVNVWRILNGIPTPRTWVDLTEGCLTTDDFTYQQYLIQLLK